MRFGAEALRQQRGRNEIRVRVKRKGNASANMTSRIY